MSLPLEKIRKNSKTPITVQLKYRDLSFHQVAEALGFCVPNNCVYRVTYHAMSTTLESVPDQYPAPMGRQASLSHDAEKSSNQQSPPDEVLVESDEARKIRGFRWLIICISLYTTCFLYGLDTTIAADVQSAVITRFGHVDQISWIGAGFPLGSVSFYSSIPFSTPSI